MGFLIVRVSCRSEEFAPFIITLSDNDTLHDYFHEYLAQGWTQEILSYLPNDIDDWDISRTLEKREERAHQYEGDMRWA